jgi:glucose/arabinose dehydrogenase
MMRDVGPFSRAALIFLVLLLGLASGMSAATLRTGFAETQIASGLLSPTAMAFAPDGRLFVCQQGGQLRVIKNGVLLSTPFVSLTVDPSGERGLLGVAFDPAFASNRFVYVYYTARTPTIHNRVSRFTANGDVAVSGSEVVILDLNPLSSANNHNGGAMHFGVDGKLYVAVGDNATAANSQTLSNLLGKMLRLNADGTIPTNNPFFNQASGVNRAIWARGLRNPFTFSIHSVSGRMFINDVGNATFEEINEGGAGENYGWPNTEGPTNDPVFQTPRYSYRHGTGDFLGCAITGGAFYTGTPQQFPASYTGDYFFADYCGGWINQLDESAGLTVTKFASGIVRPVDLQEGPEGHLYYLARGSGTNTGVVYRISYSQNQAPTITQQPASRTVSLGQSATFTVVASGTAPLSYRWQRNGANITGATASSYTLASATAADNNAQFRCVVSNSAGTATSNIAVLTVSTNRLPVPTILTPVSGTLYTAGTTISYSGSATDPENGNLAASRFTWEVVFHHDTHTHPFIGPISGVTSGSFVIPAIGETSSNVWYRIRLTVTDLAGASATTFRDIRPRTVLVTLSSTPAGARLTLDGQPVVAPFTFTGVVGLRRAIGTTSPQTIGGKNYVFKSWSDGGSLTHTITTPSSNTTFTAQFRRGNDH